MYTDEGGMYFDYICWFSPWAAVQTDSIIQARKNSTALTYLNLEGHIEVKVLFSH